MLKQDSIEFRCDGRVGKVKKNHTTVSLALVLVALFVVAGQGCGRFSSDDSDAGSKMSVQQNTAGAPFFIEDSTTGEKVTDTAGELILSTGRTYWITVQLPAGSLSPNDLSWSIQSEPLNVCQFTLAGGEYGATRPFECLAKASLRIRAHFPGDEEAPDVYVLDVAAKAEPQMPTSTPSPSPSPSPSPNPSATPTPMPTPTPTPSATPTPKPSATPTPTPTPTPSPTPGDGAKLYGMKCASCHLALDGSTVRGATAVAIKQAINNYKAMRRADLMALTPAQLEAIAAALAFP